MRYRVRVTFRDGNTIEKHFASRKMAGYYCSRLRSKGTTKRIRMTTTK